MIWTNPSYGRRRLGEIFCIGCFVSLFAQTVAATECEKGEDYTESFSGNREPEACGMTRLEEIKAKIEGHK